jgi:hypothetical protein
MKKKLEADLISIAHRILKLKNKSELNQLHHETQQLYEKLSVLLFVETHFSEAKPTIGHAEIAEKIATAFEADDQATTIATAPIATEVIPEIAAEPVAVTKSEPVVEAHIEQVVVPATTPANDFETNFKIPEAAMAEPEKKKEIQQISFEDILGGASEPVFERVSNKTPEAETIVPNAMQPEEVFIEVATEIEVEAVSTPEAVSEQREVEQEATPSAFNDTFKRIITFGLNDRIAFEKNLFGGSGEDLNRVLSQLSTYDNFQEANSFIEDMVKPDYNNWEGKEDYAQRFMEIVEKKFV